MAPKSLPRLPVNQIPSDSSPSSRKPEDDDLDDDHGGDKSQGEGDYYQKEIPEEEDEGKTIRIPQTKHAAEVSLPYQFPPPTSKPDFDASQKSIPEKRPTQDQKDGSRKSKRGKVVGGVNKNKNKKKKKKKNIDYAQLNNASDLSARMYAIYGFLKGRLYFDFAKTQVYEKIRRLKKKYKSNSRKYERSGNRKLELTEVDEVNVEEDEGSFLSKYPFPMESLDNVKNSGPSRMTKLMRNFLMKKVNLIDRKKAKEPDVKWMTESMRNFLMKKVNLIDREKAKELDIKRKELRREEIEIFLNKLHLRNELMILVLDAMKG